MTSACGHSEQSGESGAHDTGAGIHDAGAAPDGALGDAGTSPDGALSDAGALPDGALSDAGTSSDGAQDAIASPVPQAWSSTAQVEEDGEVTITLRASGPAERALQISITEAPEHGMLLDGPSGLEVVYRPSQDFHGQDAFAFIVSDGEQASEKALVSIEVRPVNDAPVVEADTIVVGEGDSTGTLAGGATSLLANDHDAEGDALSVDTVPVADPAHGTLTVYADGTFFYEHDGSETTQDSFTVRVSDGTASTDEVVDVTVTPKNDAPLLEASFATTVAGAGGALPFRIAVADPDDDSLAVEAELSADGGASFSPVAVFPERVGRGGSSIAAATGLSDDASHQDLGLRVRVSDGSLTSAWIESGNIAFHNRRVVYVDGDGPDGLEDGSSWVNAFHDLGAALAAADAGSTALGALEIWVARGTYVPDASSEGRGASFRPISGSTIAGGFAAGDWTKLQRMPDENPTVLSGDLGTPGDAGDNAYHVVEPEGDVVLDGLVIAGGNGEHTYNGGGVLVAQGPVTLRQCVVRDNIGRDGGGLFIAAGLLRVVGSRIVSNEARAYGGGGIAHAANDATIHLFGSLVAGNAGTYGGGILLTSPSQPLAGGHLIQASTIAHNSVTGSGFNRVGGISCNYPFAVAQIENSIVWGNQVGGLTGLCKNVTVRRSLIQGSQGSGSSFWQPTTNGPRDGGNNLDADPHFVDAGGSDFRLGSASAAVDVGAAALLPDDAFDLDSDGNTSERLSLDVAGQPRIADGNGDDLAEVDMGAFERPAD